MACCIPFISYTSLRGFELNSQAKELLSFIDQTIPLAVVAITGKARTGKSFLLN